MRMLSTEQKTNHLTQNSSLRERTVQLLRQECQYIHSRSYETLSVDELNDSCPEDAYSEAESIVEGQVNGLGLVTGSDVRLLTKEGEEYLFRRMNFFAYRANMLRSRLNPARPRRAIVEETEYCIQQAQEARSQLVQANVRLVASLANKFSNARVDFDELVSEGNLILLNAIDKFDVDRGFRFSTYATHAIQRHYYRVIQRKQRRRGIEVSAPSEVLADSLPVYDQDGDMIDDAAAGELIRRLGECLDEREQLIIRDRFALEGTGNRKAKTLKTLAIEMGLSKERVRQLQYRALDKLRELCRELNLFPNMELC